jgi:plastocyanin
MRYSLKSARFGLPALLLLLAAGIVLAQSMQSGRTTRPASTGMAAPQRPSSPYVNRSGYGSGTGGGSQGYGFEPPGTAPAGEGPAAAEPAKSETGKAARLLKAVGLPTDNGQLRWPAALLALSTPGTDEYDLREQIDALYEEAVDQAAQGPVNTNLAREMNHAVKELRRLVNADRPERYALPSADWREGESFVNKLENASRVLAAGLQAPGEERQLGTRPDQTEVGIADNAFQPETLTVPAGTTVRWLNNSQLRHTVTSDDERWSSLDLGPKDVYRHTFTEPGTYRYHCSKHPHEMRGTIVVK